jgi:hypothetical protein
MNNFSKRVLVSAGALFVVLFSSAVAAQQANVEDAHVPHLRIETGGHTASISRVVTNKAGSVIATGSDDKTIRLWDAGGKALGVLRIPIGPDDHGQIHALALSPDGIWLAAGGITGDIANGNFAVFLFNVDQQRLIGRLGGLPGPIRDLAFSKDGARLAIAVAGKGGVRVLNIADNKREFEDFSGPGRVEAVTFRESGELAAASHNGSVYIYNRAGAVIANRQVAPTGAHPSSLSFSPDGALLAIAFDDKPRVLVLSAADLSQRAQADVSGVQRGALTRVAWTSHSGELRLIAAGTAQNAKLDSYVRIWKSAGSGPFTDTVVAGDSVNHLEPLPNGGFLFAAADPVWGHVAPGGEIPFRQRGLIADFRDVIDGRFALSADGLSVEFGMIQGGKQPIRFDLADRRVTQNPPVDQKLRRPSMAATAKLRTSSWRNFAKPTLAGKPLALEKNELARSLALSQDDQFFVLGTDQHIRVFNQQGQETARTSIPAAAWGVAMNAKGDGVVAALGDGTLRWYRRSSGADRTLKELAALFMHADGKRWVAWTPEGFFDHSDDGGKDLVGYQFNRGRLRKPDYVSFSQLYRLFYAPDLVARRFAGEGDAEMKIRLDEIGDLSTLLDRVPPPEIVMEEVCWQTGGVRACQPMPLESTVRGLARSDSAATTAPPPNAPSNASRPASVPFASLAVMDAPAGVDRVQIRFRVTNRGGGLGSIHVFDNERSLGRFQTTRGLQRTPPPGQTVPSFDPVIEEREVLLDDGKNVIQLRAYDANDGVYAESQTLEMTTSVGGLVEPELYILAAGIDAYGGSITPLKYAIADAQSVAKRLELGSKGVFAKSHISILRDSEVSSANLDAQLGDLARKARPTDTVLMYFAGHGVVTKAGYVFVTTDVTQPDENELNKGFGEQRILAAWSKIRARNTVLFLDTCHAGGLSLDFAGKISHESGRYVLAAASSVEGALDSYNGQNGVFAHSVLQGLAAGARRDVDGKVNNFDLGWYVREAVPKLAREKNHVQRAAFRGQSEELVPFPVASLAETPAPVKP